MKSYALTITGWELEASGHSLTDDEVKKIREYQDENEIDSLDLIGSDLENIIEGYYSGDGNMWSIIRPLENDRINCVLSDSDDPENTIIEFGLDEMGNHDEYQEDYEITNYNGYPTEEKEKNILLWFGENKGTICSFNFESEEVPTSKDFTYIRGSIETPDGDWDVVDKVFFKGKELEPNWDCEWVTGKALTVQLWTL